MAKVIIVPVQIKPGFKERFIAEIVGHAGRTRTNEAGCLRFDIIQDGNDSNRIWLYEVYRDEEALETHVSSPTLAEWHSSPSQEWREPAPFNPSTGPSIWPPDEEWA